MIIVVSGATSQIGHFLLPRLLADGHRVIAVSRRPAAGGSCGEWLQGQLPDAMSLLSDVRPDVWVNFAPLDALVSWLQCQQTAPAQRLIVTSSMSVVTKRHSPDPGERALAERLATGEAGISAECQRLGMEWVIMRPTLIYGAGIDKSLSPIARRAMRMRLFPLPAVSGLRQPVHADDIALAVVALLERQDLRGRTIEIGGGERIPYRVMFKRVRDSLQVATLPVPLPAWGLRAAATLLPAVRGPIERLTSDLLADNTQLRETLGVHPRRFAPTADMWIPSMPGAAAVGRERSAAT